MGRVEHFIRVVGSHEDAIFAKRARMLNRDRQRRERDKAMAAGGGGPGGRGGGGRPGDRGPGKWTAAAPSAAYMASLTAAPAPDGGKGPVVRPFAKPVPVRHILAIWRRSSARGRP